MNGRLKPRPNLPVNKNHYSCGRVFLKTNDVLMPGLVLQLGRASCTICPWKENTEARGRFNVRICSYLVVILNCLVRHRNYQDLQANSLRVESGHPHMMQHD